MHRSPNPNPRLDHHLERERVEISCGKGNRDMLRFQLNYPGAWNGVSILGEGER